RRVGGADCGHPRGTRVRLGVRPAPALAGRSPDRPAAVRETGVQRVRGDVRSDDLRLLRGLPLPAAVPSAGARTVAAGGRAVGTPLPARLHLRLVGGAGAGPSG